MAHLLSVLNSTTAQYTLYVMVACMGVLLLVRSKPLTCVPTVGFALVATFVEYTRATAHDGAAAIIPDVYGNSRGAQYALAHLASIERTAVGASVALVLTAGITGMALLTQPGVYGFWRHIGWPVLSVAMFMGAHALSSFGRTLDIDDRGLRAILLIAAAAILVLGVYMLTVGRRHWRVDIRPVTG